MTHEEVIALAHTYGAVAESARTLGHSLPTLAHLSTMPDKMAGMVDDPEKLMRWLGFMQGVLFAAEVFSLDDLRHHNKYGYRPASTALYRRITE